MKDLRYTACPPKDTLYGLQPGMICSPRFGHFLALWNKITILGLRGEVLNHYLYLFRCWTCEYLCIHITYLLRGALLMRAMACCGEVARRTAALTPSASLPHRALLGMGGGNLSRLWQGISARAGLGLVLELSITKKESSRLLLFLLLLLTCSISTCGCDDVAKTAVCVNGAGNVCDGVSAN